MLRVNLVRIGSSNGLSPGQSQVITWTNAGLLPIRPLGTNFSEIRIKIQSFSFMKMHFEMSAKWWPFCTGGMGSTVIGDLKWLNNHIPFLRGCPYPCPKFTGSVHRSHQLTIKRFNIGPCNDLVLGAKPLHEPMLQHVPWPHFCCFNDFFSLNLQ